MEGREVFRKAVRATVESAERVLKQADVTAEESPCSSLTRRTSGSSTPLASESASIRALCICLEHTGNTSAASCGIALAEAADAGRLKDGDLVLFSGFGAGMTWASAVVRWGGAPAAPTHADGPRERADDQTGRTAPRWPTTRPVMKAPTQESVPGRVILVTGGSRGIGLACARRFQAAATA